MARAAAIPQPCRPARAGKRKGGNSPSLPFPPMAHDTFHAGFDFRDDFPSRAGRSGHFRPVRPPFRRRVDRRGRVGLLFSVCSRCLKMQVTDNPWWCRGRGRCQFDEFSEGRSAVSFLFRARAPSQGSGTFNSAMLWRSCAVGGTLATIFFSLAISLRSCDPFDLEITLFSAAGDILGVTAHGVLRTQTRPGARPAPPGPRHPAVIRSGRSRSRATRVDSRAPPSGLTARRPFGCPRTG